MSDTTGRKTSAAGPETLEYRQDVLTLRVTVPHRGNHYLVADRLEQIAGLIRGGFDGGTIDLSVAERGFLTPHYADFAITVEDAVLCRPGNEVDGS